MGVNVAAHAWVGVQEPCSTKALLALIDDEVFVAQESSQLGTEGNARDTAADDNSSRLPHLMLYAHCVGWVAKDWVIAVQEATRTNLCCSYL